MYPVKQPHCNLGQSNIHQNSNRLHCIRVFKKAKLKLLVRHHTFASLSPCTSALFPSQFSSTLAELLLLSCLQYLLHTEFKKHFKDRKTVI